MNNSNDVHNKSLKKKIPKKKKFGQISIVLNTNTEEKTCEKDVEQNIYDFSEIVKTKKKSINASENILLKNNEFDAIKKLRKKNRYIKSLNLIECSTNNYTRTNMFEKSSEEVGEQKIDFYIKNNINIKTKSKVNALAYHKTSEEASEQDINYSGSWKNLNQTLKSELNNSLDISLENNSSINNNSVVTKKLEKKKKHNKSLSSIELNTNNDIEIKSFEKPHKEDKQKINDFSFRENLSEKINLSSDISLENNSRINNNSMVTKKLEKKKKHNKSLNSIELNTINDKEIKSSEKTYKEDEEPNIIKFFNNISQKRKYKINGLVDVDNVSTKKLKKKKNHDNSLNTNHDTEDLTFEEVDKQNINDSETINCKIDDENVQTKGPKKKKHNKSLNSIELNTNNDKEIKSSEKTYKEDEEPNIINFLNNIGQKRKYKINGLADIDNVSTKKLKKKKNHNNSLNTNHDTEDITFQEVDKQNINDSETINCIIDDENVQTKRPKKKKHNKNLNSIELNTNNDIEIKSFEKLYKEDEQKINDFRFRENLSEKINLSSDISLENNSRINNNNMVTKKLEKKKNHNKSLNSIELNTINDKEIKSSEKTYKEDEEPNIINVLYNISQKQKNKENSLADIDNVSTKKLKKKKNHDDSLITNHDTEDITFEEVGKQNINDSGTIKCIIHNENVQTKEPKNKKKHNKSLNPLELNTINDSKIDTINRTDLKSDESIVNSSTNISMSNSKKFKVNNVYTPNIVEATDNNCSMSKNEKIISVISESYSSTDLEISQNHYKLKTLLNSMEFNDFEGVSTKFETKFNLIKYLKNKKSSLQSHPKFKQINEILSKKIKDIVNKNCQITNSDIVLLKTVGNIILEKIVEKMNAAQDINDITITLPPECKENKIHFIETALGRPPSKEKMNIIKKLNPQVKLRVFNIEEDNMIREYWSKFQKEYKITNILPFLSNGLEMALDNTQKLQFVRYISAGLPNRLLSSVFIRFNVLFSGHQDKIRFSQEEDQLIMKVEKCDVIKRKLSVLSLILNRSRMQLYRRHDVLKNQFEKCKKVCWTDQKRQELFTNILLETNTDNWKDLKNLTLKKNTLIKIAENLGEDVTFEKVRKQWNYLYTMLFCEKPIKMLSLRLKILKLLEQQNFKHFSDVNWIKITNQLYPGANSKLICDIFHCWIDKNVPSNLKKNIKDTLNYLREHKVDKLRKEIHKHGEREFPRLTVQDYDLLVVIDE